jgi:ribosomal protein S3AE
VSRVARGRWQVTDARSDKTIASFDGWRAARDHVKTLTKSRSDLAAVVLAAGSADAKGEV